MHNTAFRVRIELSSRAAVAGKIVTRENFAPLKLYVHPAVVDQSLGESTLQKMGQIITIFDRYASSENILVVLLHSINAKISISFLQPTSILFFFEFSFSDHF